MIRLKKFLVMLMMAVPLLLVGSSASAQLIILDDWTFDLNAASAGLGTESPVDYINWDSGGAKSMEIYQYLGGGANPNALDDGDTFWEKGYMQGFTVANEGGSWSIDLTDNTPTTYNLFIKWNALTGVVSGYETKSTADLADDTWDYDFYTGAGTAEILLDTDNDPFTNTGGEISLMTMTVGQPSSGTADGFLHATGAGSYSNWAMTMEATSAHAGVWIDPDGVTDLWTKYGTKGWLMALPQGVTNLDEGYTPGYGWNPVTSQNENYYLFKGHSGDTMKLGAIPEPATMLLLGSGLIGLAGFGRKKFFKKN